MATKKKVLKEADVQACLVIIRDMYARYGVDEIVQAYIINRQEITAREEQARLANELKNIQQQLDTPTE